MATRVAQAAEPDVAPSVPASASAATSASSSPPGAAAEAAPPAEPQSGSRAGVAPAAPIEIVVTATRSPRRSRDVAASATVLSRAAIDQSPAKTSDELLRVVPSFGLFRRSSSVVADPSSQGVNLRGIGPSGVSRSLVLRDGLPMNDGFGGWVYWRAMPTLGIERIEVVPGGGSALYGNYALGGVTQIISRPITPSTLDVIGEGGSFATLRLGAFGSHRRADGRIGAAIETELFRSNGYPVVAEDARGRIDGDTPGWHAAVNGRVELKPTKDVTLLGRVGFFHEDQNGGTQYTTANVQQAELVSSVRYTPRSVGAFELTLFSRNGTFKQDRARVTADRSAEFLAGRQDVPTQEGGGALLWTSQPLPFVGKHTLSVGSDVRLVRGETNEHLYPPAPIAPGAVVQRDAVGDQLLFGIFAQDVYDVLDAVSLSAAIRYDRWLNSNASRTEQVADGTTHDTVFPQRVEDRFSPKLGLRVHATEWLTLRASLYQSFRAPTLNELYRPFQVGTIRTEANEKLTAETLKGGEAGVEVTLPLGFAARTTGFWNVLENPIVNVTTPDTAPNRQRQNLGQARIRGLEAEARFRFASFWLAKAAYTFVDSRVTDAPGQPQLVGKELPQDPRHRASVSLAFDDPRSLTVNAQLRYIGAQYEDDLNTLSMAGVPLFDIFVSWHVRSFLDTFAAIENLFDRTYLVGRSGVDTIGQPRFIHFGLRFHTNPRS
ncbi:MAG TPA: TonB-dependent receptor [Polyangiaceae bacterium]|nr:TonB-dependent receptor [Polyangiaceae bacterium]